MIRIEVIRLANGLYAGRTVSDRWNLLTLQDLGIVEGLQLTINKCENKGQLDRLRRTLKGMGFQLSVVRGKEVVEMPSEAEMDAMRSPETTESTGHHRLIA